MKVSALSAVADRVTFDRCASAGNLSEACRGLVDDLAEAGIALPSVYLFVGDRLRCFAARGYFQVVDGFPREAGVIGRTVSSGEPVHLPDISHVPEFIAAIPGLRGEACVPVWSARTVIGAVNAESMDVLPVEWLRILEEGAGVLGTRIDELGGLPGPSRMQRVARAVIELTGHDDPEAIVASSLRWAVSVAEMSSAAVALCGPGGVMVAGAVGPLAGGLASLTSEQLTAMCSWVAAGTSSHFPGGDDVPPSYDFLAPIGLRSLSVQPLVAGGQPMGLMLVADSQPHPHDPSAVEALEMLAAQTATALAAARTLESARSEALSDALTGCLNVAAFTRELHALAAGRRGGACLLVDIDHFKQVNDTAGHLAGDRVLVDTVRTLHASVRSGDRVYRLGGDEFAVLTETSQEEGVARLAGRLLDCVRPLGVTVSIGYATTGGGETADAVRARADAALYAAKHAGRDTVRPSEPAAPQLTT